MGYDEGECLKCYCEFGWNHPVCIDYTFFCTPCWEARFHGKLRGRATGAPDMYKHMYGDDACSACSKKTSYGFKVPLCPMCVGGVPDDSVSAESASDHDSVVLADDDLDAGPAGDDAGPEPPADVAGEPSSGKSAAAPASDAAPASAASAASAVPPASAVAAASAAASAAAAAPKSMTMQEFAQSLHDIMRQGDAKTADMMAAVLYMCSELSDTLDLILMVPDLAHKKDYIDVVQKALVSFSFLMKQPVGDVMHPEIPSSLRTSGTLRAAIQHLWKNPILLVQK